MLDSVGCGELPDAETYGDQRADPLVFAIAPGVLLFVALIAIARPAARAARIDPVKALRAD